MSLAVKREIQKVCLGVMLMTVVFEHVYLPNPYDCDNGKKTLAPFSEKYIFYLSLTRDYC